AADLHDGAEVVFRSGALWPAVLASSSIPVLYPAVEIGGRGLVDGGIVPPLPLRAGPPLRARPAGGVRPPPRPPPPPARPPPSRPRCRGRSPSCRAAAGARAPPALTS